MRLLKLYIFAMSFTYSNENDISVVEVNKNEIIDEEIEKVTIQNIDNEDDSIEAVNISNHKEEDYEYDPVEIDAISNENQQNTPKLLAPQKRQEGISEKITESLQKRQEEMVKKMTESDVLPIFDLTDEQPPLIKVIELEDDFYSIKVDIVELDDEAEPDNVIIKEDTSDFKEPFSGIDIRTIDEIITPQIIVLSDIDVHDQKQKNAEIIQSGENDQIYSINAQKIASDPNNSRTITSIKPVTLVKKHIKKPASLLIEQIGKKYFVAQKQDLKKMKHTTHIRKLDQSPNTEMQIEKLELENLLITTRFDTKIFDKESKKIAKQIQFKTKKTSQAQEKMLFWKAPNPYMNALEYITWLQRTMPKHSTIYFCEQGFKTLSLLLLWYSLLSYSKIFKNIIIGSSNLRDYFPYLNQMVGPENEMKLMIYMTLFVLPISIFALPSVTLLFEHTTFAAMRYLFTYFNHAVVKKDFKEIMQERLTKRAFTQIMNKKLRYYLKYPEAVELVDAIMNISPKLIKAYDGIVVNFMSNFINLIMNIAVRTIAYSLEEAPKQTRDKHQYNRDEKQLYTLGAVPMLTALIITGLIMYALKATMSKSIRIGEKRLHLVKSRVNQHAIEALNNILTVKTVNMQGIEYYIFRQNLEAEANASRSLAGKKLRMKGMLIGSSFLYIALHNILRSFLPQGKEEWQTMKNIYNNSEKSFKGFRKELNNVISDPLLRWDLRNTFSVALNLGMDVHLMYSLIGALGIFDLSQTISDVNQYIKLIESLDVEKDLVPNKFPAKDPGRPDDIRGRVDIDIYDPGYEYLSEEEERIIERYTEELLTIVNK